MGRSQYAYTNGIPRDLSDFLRRHHFTKFRTLVRAGFGTGQMSNVVKMKKYWANEIKNDLFDDKSCINAILENQSMTPRMG